MVKALVRRAIRNFGIEVSRYDPAHSEYARFQSMLTSHGVNLLFDVGANQGGFAKDLREIGYRNRIVSFEPLSEAWNQLKAASSSDPLWEVAPRGAIGAEEGEIEMHVAANSVSSSALGMLDAHLKAAPNSGYVTTEKAQLRRLDSLGAEYLRPDSVLFIKIDTQGFEGQVLRGAREILKRTVGLRLELSFVPLYENQPLFDDLISELKELGFDLWGWTPEFYDPTTGRLLQGDGTFFRR